MSKTLDSTAQLPILVAAMSGSDAPIELTSAGTVGNIDLTLNVEELWPDISCEA
jgi:hypothetical protein